MSELQQPQLSFVIPCLNEALCLEAVLRECHAAGVACGVPYEIVVADNGSSDGSQAIASQLGARLVAAAQRGYGAALQAGIAASSGRFLLMGDADGTYAFCDAPRFLERLQHGDQLVMGNRFRGGIEQGAMPWLHRHLGNPVLSWLGRLFFGIRVGDFHCGLRGFEQQAIRNLQLREAGMEFASEMVIKACLMELRISEVPTTLRRGHPDRHPHLRTWRDGWRHLRFMLSFSPRYSLLPLAWMLLLLALLAVACYALQLGPLTGPNTLILASFALMAGLVLLSDYVTTRLLVTQLYAYRGRPGMDQLMGRLCSYRGTNRLFQLSALLLLACTATVAPLLLGADQHHGISISSRASHLLLFTSASLLTGSFFSYLTATKLSTVLALRPQPPAPPARADCSATPATAPPSK